MSTDFALMDLSDIATAIAERRVTSLAVTEACLARIRQWQPEVNCFIRMDEAAALETACQCDLELARGHRRGVLHGVPLAHKDLFYRAGRISTAGSGILRDYKPNFTATVLRRLDEAGAVDLGTLNMSEFAAGPTGHNVHFGDCRNAFDRTCVAGGSSSGSAVAVAARLAFGALGTDTGASIRLPAAANGVTGLKPTYGRVSRHGVFPRSWSLDHVGPIARTARDCAILLQVIAGYDEMDASSSVQELPPIDKIFSQTRLEGLRLGVPTDGALGDLDADVTAALMGAKKTLESLGATVRTVPFTDPAQMFQVAEVLVKSEGAAIHRAWLKDRKQEYSNHVRIRIEAGLLIPATQYIDAQRLRVVLTTRFLDETMAGIDALYLPVIPFRVPKIHETDIERRSGEEVLRVVGELTRLTRPVNLLGLPAISVPCGFCRKGMPIAFQLVGHPFDEATLLRVAHLYQQTTNFHRQVPSLQSTPVTQTVTTNE